MPAVKGQRRSSARPAADQWLDGVAFKFKKTPEKASPIKKSPKTKNRRQSILLKRLDINVQDLSSSPSKSPSRVRRTRRMSMAALTNSAKKAAATSKIPRSSSEKQMPRANSKAALPPVAKMTASTTTSRSNLPPKGKVQSSSKSKSSSSKLNVSSSSSSTVVTTTSTSTVSKDESWIEKITSPKIFYKQTPPSPKLSGAQKRKSYTSATSVLQIELDAQGQKRVRESSPSPVKSKKARVMSQTAKSPARSAQATTPVQSPPVKKRGRGRPVSNPANSKVLAQKSPQKSVTPAKSKPVKKEKTPQKSITPTKSKPMTKGKTPRKSISKSKPDMKEFTPERSITPAKSRPMTRGKTPQKSSSKSKIGTKDKTPEKSITPAKSKLVSRRMTPRKSSSQSVGKLTKSSESSPSKKDSLKSPGSGKKKSIKQSSMPVVQISPLNMSLHDKTLSVKKLRSIDNKITKKSPTPSKSPAAAKKSPAAAKKSPAAAKKSPAAAKKSPAAAKKILGSTSMSKALGAVSPVSPGSSPALRRAGALTRSARKKPYKKVVIKGSSPAMTSIDYRKKTPKSSVATSRITTNKSLLVSVKSTNCSPELTRYISKSSLAAPSPVKRLVKASRANPFTPKPEAQPSKLLKQNMRNKLTTDMTLFKKVGAAALMDPRVSTVRTPTQTALRGAGFVSGSTPASSPSLPPTPTSARKYASRSALMVATARRKISIQREDNQSSVESTPLNSTPRPSSHLFSSYSNGSSSVTPPRAQQFNISETSSASEAEDFTASVQMVEDQDSLSSSQMDKQEAVQAAADDHDETDSGHGKKNAKKGYCSVM